MIGRRRRFRDCRMHGCWAREVWGFSSLGRQNFFILNHTVLHAVSRDNSCYYSYNFRVLYFNLGFLRLRHCPNENNNSLNTGLSGVELPLGVRFPSISRP
jgi:hypothetical protein